MNFSERAKTLKGSATMNATLKAQEKIKNGEDIVLASVGEPDSKAPKAAKDELIKRVQNSESKYGPAQGLLSTRKVISSWMNNLYNQKWTAENVVISPGSKYSLYSILQILCDEKSEVIIPSPYWVSYETLAKLSGAFTKIVNCGPEENYKLSGKRLKQALSKNSKILLLNSPQNPTGAIYTIPELKDLAQVISENPDLFVICDDIYNQLVFSEEQRCPHLLDVLPAQYHSQVIVVHGASKSFALTGWRLGWILSDKQITQKLTEFQSQTLTCIPDFLQSALEKTLELENNFVVELKHLIQQRHARVVNALKTCPGIKIYPSQGAFYVWMEVLDKAKTSAQICEELLSQHGLALVPGYSFGCEHHLRFSVTINDDLLDKGVQRLMEYFKK